MKIFLDDLREPPIGWIRVEWPEEVVQHLETGKVTDLSLDHDLGDDECGTGYDVLLWIEQQVALNKFKPPRIAVHSANSSARIKMALAISKIEQLVALNEGA